MNNLDCQILRTVFANPELPKEVLLCANPSIRYCEKRLKDLADSGLIKIEKFQSGKTKKDGFTTTVEITPKGIRYLKANDRETPWVQKLKLNEVDKVKVLPTYFRSSAGQLRQIQKLSEVNGFISLSDNAVTIPVPLLHKAVAIKPDKGACATIDGTQIKMLYDAMNADGNTSLELATKFSKYDIGNLTNRNFRFIPKGIVAQHAHSDRESIFSWEDEMEEDKDIKLTKSGLEYKVLTSEQRRDNASKMVGVIDSFQNLMTVYCTSGNTFLLQNEQVLKDKKLVLDWAPKHSILLDEKPRLNESLSGILLVKNHVQFASIFADKKKLRNRKGTDVKNPIHASLSTLYVVPKTYTGLRYLEWLVTLDIDGYYSYMKNKLLEEAGVTENTDRSFICKRYMPVKKDGRIIAIGTIISTALIEKIKEKQKTEEITVLCYEWQEEYYKKCIGGIVQIEVDNINH